MNAITSNGELSVHKSRQCIMKSAGLVDLRPASVDRVDSVFDLFHPVVAFQFWRYEFAAFAIRCEGSNTRVAFRSPSDWEPRNLCSVVVGSDWGVVARGQGGFEFDSEGDVVGVHSEVPFRVGSWCFALRNSLRVTHMSHACLGTSSQVLHVSGSNVHVFSNATIPPNLARVRVETCAKHGANITQNGDSARTVATVANCWGVAA